MSRSFLQSVIDAFPDALMVIDVDHRIVLANQTAQDVFGSADVASNCLKCYQYSHHRETPCAGDNDPCPLREVIATKAPVRVHHTHFDSDGKEVSVAIDAAPVLNERGEVVQIVESCRDITESVIARRLLRIGNRHRKIGPLLEEAAAALRAFTGCAVVGIRILDENGGVSSCSHGPSPLGPSESKVPLGGQSDPCGCLKIINGDTLARLAPAMEGVSVYTDCREQFLAPISDEERDRLGDACHLCECESLALVPIVFDNHFLGVIHFACHRRSAVSPTVVESLERLAIELGTAIKRVRAEEALQAARDELETRVQQRTAELTRANRALEDEIAQRTQLERDILQVAANEQRRIGQELHDGIGQQLTGLSYLARSLYQKLQANDSGESDIADELARSIPLVLAQIGQVVKGLLPLEIGASDLDSALELLATNVTGQTGISCRFESSGFPRVSDDDMAIQLYRIAQEAIANAVKHAQPRHILVALKAEGNQLCLEIRDDGDGIPANAEESSGRGLRTMKSRARAMHGLLEVRPMADGGTLVACVLLREVCLGLNAEGSTK